jgi:hypothetical protein
MLSFTALVRHWPLLIPLFLTPLMASQAHAQGSPEPDWENVVFVPPLLQLQEAEEGKRGSFLWPFIYWERAGSEVAWGFRPLILYRRNLPENRIKVDLIWPLFQWDRDRQQLDWRLFPLFGGWPMNQQWGDSDRYFIVFPLYWSIRDAHHRSIVMPPFVHLREKSGENTMRFDALLPFWTGNDTRTQETTHSLFPFIWGKRDGALAYFVAFPIFWNINYPDGAHLRALLPLWGEKTHIGEDGSLLERIRIILWPLWVETVKDEGLEVRRSVLWPLVSWGHGPQSRLTRFLPFFSYQVDAFSAGSDFERRDLILFPVWISRHYETGVMYARRFTAPLVWHWWGPDFGDRHIDSWGFYPLVHGHSVEGVGKHFSIFCPLFFLEDSDVFLEGTGFHERFSMLWQLFSRSRTEDGQRVETQLLWRLFHHVREGDNTRLSVFPFITHERESDRWRTAFLWRFFEFNREPEGNSVRLLFSPRIPIGGGSEATTPAPSP